MGPTCANVGVADVGQTGTRPNWPLSPTRPVREEGMRIDPPPSVPNPNGVTPAAMDAAAPALEPPGVFATFQGLRVIPVKGLSPPGLQPYSLVVVFPMMTAPAALSLSTEGASSGATCPHSHGNLRRKEDPR